MQKTLIQSVINFFIIYISKKIGFEMLWHQHIWYILSFFISLSYLNQLLLKLGFSNNRENFVQFFLSTNIIRLLLSVVFIGAFAYSGVQNIKLFIIDFFVLYLCYTGFEIYFLYRKLQDF